MPPNSYLDLRDRIRLPSQPACPLAARREAVYFVRRSMATARDRRRASHVSAPAISEEIDIYARISRAANGETIKVDDQIEMGTDDIKAQHCTGVVL